MSDSAHHYMGFLGILLDQWGQLSMVDQDRMIELANQRAENTNPDHLELADLAILGAMTLAELGDGRITIGKLVTEGTPK